MDILRDHLRWCAGLRLLQRRVGLRSMGLEAHEGPYEAAPSPCHTLNRSQKLQAPEAQLQR